MGILVINEAFDMWREAKRPQDYHIYFDEWWKKDMEAMVLRDRNHPSPYRDAYQGRCLVIVRSQKQTGKITLKASVSGVNPASVDILTK